MSFSRVKVMHMSNHYCVIGINISYVVNIMRIEHTERESQGSIGAIQKIRALQDMRSGLLNKIISKLTVTCLQIKHNIYNVCKTVY